MLHPPRPRTQRTNFALPVLAPRFCFVLSTYCAPSSEWNDHTRAVILGTQVSREIDDGFRCALRRVGGTCKVDDFLVGDERGNAIGDEDHVCVVSSYSHLAVNIRVRLWDRLDGTYHSSLDA
jgi:hypothetical protein